jgi:RHS repeat-associated protein
MVATDATGNVVWKESYRPYGDKLRKEPASGNNTNKIGYAGSPFDAGTGLSYMGARYYDPVIGRFMGIDPVGFQEDNVHSFNRYAYANNNPYKFVDRDGREPELICRPYWGASMQSTPANPALRNNFTANAGANLADGLLSGVVGSVGPGAAKSIVKLFSKQAAQETVKVGELVATHGQTLSNNQLDKLIKNIRIEGIKNPLTVTESEGRLYILDGHHRALAAPRAGLAEVPINRVELPYGAYKSPTDLTFTPGGY